ncbi:MAG: helix-turn-helix transcriptional regulator [Liquorilactobacillus ghanensis]|jgi:transcriptional regulator with XRE-family HTH domain|uniref:helix-turn-helix transcriptional regulator n=1 Tax=Liquorilactobacillus ghanensis TaxID=399370 RepID=UPI0039EAA94C
MKLKEARVNAGLTQQELAFKAGLSIGMVQSIEVGRRTGSVKTLKKIADVLGITINDLLYARDITISTRKKVTE